jgi:hypothetical protein
MKFFRKYSQFPSRDVTTNEAYLKSGGWLAVKIGFFLLVLFAGLSFLKETCSFFRRFTYEVPMEYVKTCYILQVTLLYGIRMLTHIVSRQNTTGVFIITLPG